MVQVPIPIMVEILRGNVNPVLARIIIDVLGLSPEAIVRFTDLNRTLQENEDAGAKSLVHVVGPPWRALDIGGRYMTEDEMDFMCDAINAIYVYDPRRPKKPVAYCKPHGKGPHVHVQVHPNTRRRDGQPV
jgi:hypothetical protein